METSSYRIVSAPPEIGFDFVVVQVLELTGDCIFRDAHVPPPFADMGDLVHVPEQHRRMLEMSFNATRAAEIFNEPPSTDPQPREHGRNVAHSLARWSLYKSRSRSCR